MKLSLRTRLVVFGLLTTITPLVFLSVIYIRNASKTLEENISENIENNSLSLAGNLNDLIEQRSRELKLLTQADVFEEGNRVQITQFLNEAIEESPDISELYFFDLEGRSIALSGSLNKDEIDFSAAKISEALFLQATKSKQGEIFRSNINQDSFSILSPVTDDSNLNVIGVLVTSIRTALIKEIIEDFRQSRLPEGKIIVFDSFGKAIASSNIPANRPHSLDTDRIQSETDHVSSEILTNESNGEKNFVTRVDFDLFGSAKTYDWTLVSSLPREVALAPLREANMTFIIITILAGLLAIIGAIWTAYTYTDPLVRATRMAKQFADDIKSIEPLENPPHEVKVLSDALMSAAGQIISKTNNIEMARKEAIRSKAETEKALEKAEIASESKTTFLAVMSHEVRTPLNAILGVAQILELDQSLSPDALGHIKMLKTAGQNLLQILSDVLDLAQIESNKLEIQTSAFDLNEVFAPVVDIHKLLCDEKKIQFNVAYECDMDATFIGDALRTRQILWNIVSNAVKFTLKGSVSIHASIAENEKFPQICELMFTVSDTGVGIPRADQSRVFESFIQVDSGKSRSFEGTGLGLAIVKNLIELLDGKIKLVSEPQVGTIVSVSLPLKRSGSSIPAPFNRQENSTNQESEKSGAKQLQSDKTRAPYVLIVDDNALNLKVLRDLLVELGYSCTIAERGDTALEVLSNKSIDLVILDEHMPSMSGRELTRTIRSKSDSRIANIPIIGLTADVLAANKNAMLNAGMNTVLNKPLDKDQLTSVLQSLQ
ncbi:ATP-binding protein [Pelagicoccus mobilis]|uniref:histidine kinase n=1 Tax=Pelagicoccus mobilis TaxID=415221 RepID=A0A934S439_9BACT|nr:ATP-binding protein [Pelagicoccus mobilis]MBK1879024.1 response regulator [Pelagicoccus mobilis]